MKELFLKLLYEVIEKKVAEKALNNLRGKYPLIKINFATVSDYVLVDKIVIRLSEDENMNIDNIQEIYTLLLQTEIANEFNKIIEKLTKED